MTAHPDARPHTPTAPEWYRVSWVETSTVLHTQVITAAELANLAAHDGADSTDPDSVTAVAADPLAHGLDDTLSELDVADDEGRDMGLTRRQITVTPLSAELAAEMGAPVGRIGCYACGARARWTGRGYVHMTTGTLSRHAPAGEWQAHLAGRFVADHHVGPLEPDNARAR